MAEIKSCLFCGRDTKSKCQICNRCLGIGKYKKIDTANAKFHPKQELFGECEYDYGEDALGPHESDKRWNFEFVEKDELINQIE